MVKKGYWMNLKASYTITVKTTGSLIFQNITSLDSAVLHITSTTRRHQDHSNWRKVVQESSASARKTYCLQVIDGQEKIAVKGINKSTLSLGVYQQMLDVLQTGDDKMAVNRGFRIHKASQDNTCKMMTYEKSKKAFNYLYCKRQVLEDKIHTKPLDIVLEPEHS